jgi:hypothetical protein
VDNEPEIVQFSSKALFFDSVTVCGTNDIGTVYLVAITFRLAGCFRLRSVDRALRQIRPVGSVKSVCVDEIG